MECVVHTKFTTNSQMRAVVLLGNREIPSTMTILHEHLIRIHFIPDESGICFVHIYNDNQLIEGRILVFINIFQAYPCIGSPYLIRIKRSKPVEITGKCLEHLRVHDLGIFRVHCHGQRGTIKAKIFCTKKDGLFERYRMRFLYIDLSVDDRSEIGQLISFQLSESYEQLTQFPSQIFQTSMTILLTARLRLTQQRIRNLILEEDNGLSLTIVVIYERNFLFSGHAVISFQLIEIPNQSPTNEQIINVLRNLIDKRILNLIDPNRNILHVICGSLMIGEMTGDDQIK